ncbi:boophilin-H2 [Denticeps clupeoides]|uniref:boophilin-H2 n=1 Tax=Denticeps clupeoides TaxID=299321 RepID=UPI0010A30079|nr:boophilin-H2-like [Denticeps clupeoides]
MQEHFCIGLLLVGIFMTSVHSMTQQCSEALNVGTGEDRLLKYFYDKDLGFCVPFFYKGDGGNENRFNSDDECLKACSPNVSVLYPEGDAVCSLPVDHGSCFAMLLMYYYNAEEKACRIFHYGGCQGNGNRFEKKEDCQRTCQAGPSGRMLESDPDRKTVDAGLIVGVIGVCVFAVALIAAVVLFVVQRKEKAKGKKKVPTSEMELS